MMPKLLKSCCDMSQLIRVAFCSSPDCPIPILLDSSIVGWLASTVLQCKCVRSGPSQREHSKRTCQSHPVKLLKGFSKCTPCRGQTDVSVSSQSSSPDLLWSALHTLVAALDIAGIQIAPGPRGPRVLGKSKALHKSAEVAFSTQGNRREQGDLPY